MKEKHSLHPWSSIWVRPRETIRQIIDSNPLKKIVTFAIIHGLISAFSWIAFVKARYPHHEEYQSFAFALFLLVGGVVLSIVHLYFGSWLFTVTSQWLRGKGNYVETKCAVGWGFYPFIIAGIFALLSYALYKNSLLAFIFGLINLGLSLWASIISLFLLAEAQQFSFWRALLAIFIAFVIIFVAIMIISLVIPLVRPLFS